MPHTETFIVRSDNKQLEPIQGNVREYWSPSGAFANTADTIISVFGYNHRTEAQKIYNALKEAGLSEHYYHITIEVK